MTRYAYRVVPAPAKGEKAKGIKSAEARFAHALERLMNDMGAEGWDYLRADTLPSEERTGLTGHVTNWRSVLVFRRALDAAAPVPEPSEDTPEDATDAADTPEPREDPEQADEDHAPPATDDWTRTAEARVHGFSDTEDTPRKPD